MPVEVNITSAASAMLSIAILGSTLIWKLLPYSNGSRTKMEKDLAVLSTEVKHVRDDITELKGDVRGIHETLRDYPRG